MGPGLQLGVILTASLTTCSAHMYLPVIYFPSREIFLGSTYPSQYPMGDIRSSSPSRPILT